MMVRRRIPGILVIIFGLAVRANAQLVFPHFVEGQGYQTTFTLTNLSDTSTDAIIHLYTQSGASLQALSMTLLANGTGSTTIGSGTLTVGWARVTTSPAVSLIGSMNIQRIVKNVLAGETTVAAVTPDVQLRLPVVERDTTSTGIAIANSGSSTARVNIALRNQNGAVVTTTVLSLASSQQVSRFVSEFFHGIGTFEGSIQIESSSPVAVVAIRQSTSGFFSAVPAIAPAPAPPEAVFAPGILYRIVQEITRAQISIDIAIYSFTLDDIRAALLDAKSRGLLIRIIADSEQAPGLGSEVSRLESAGIPLKRISGRTAGGIMHNKYAIIDNRVLVTGSYNWSYAAENTNYENAVFIRDPGVISTYQTSFNTIWNAH
jgi:phosphatidylserine/phosphatidylglycerophosphate/cardiolipin synthase-like enzyme